MKLALIFILIFSPIFSQAKDRIFLSRGKTYISIDSHSQSPEELMAEAVKFAESKPGATAKADPALRKKFFKWLTISEEEFLYVKYFGEEVTKVYKVSELDFVIELNYAGDTHVGGYGLAIKNMPGAAIAMIGKENPFKDVEFKYLPSTKGIYQVSSKYKLDLRKDGKAYDFMDPSDSNSGLSGKFDFILQHGPSHKPLKTYELESDMYISEIQVLSGPIFKDGSILIFFKQNDCGDFVKIQDGKVESWDSFCGSWGC